MSIWASEIGHSGSFSMCSTNGNGIVSLSGIVGEEMRDFDEGNPLTI